MNNLLKEISKKAIKYEDLDFSSEQIEKEWLGDVPATEKEISDAEIRLSIKFPLD